jgi:hypothetical protein
VAFLESLYDKGQMQMTEPSDRRARRRIRRTFDLVVADGMRADAVAGASAEQLRAWAVSQGVSQLPAAVAEVFGLLGVQQGPWWYGCTAAISRLDEEMKEIALECLESASGELADSRGMLLLLTRGGHEFHVVDGVDVGQDDPPVWRIVEGDPIDRHWNGVTAWFDSAAAAVRAMREQVRRAAEKDQDGHVLALQQFFRS